MKRWVDIIKEAAEDDLEEYDGEAIKDNCTRQIPEQISFIDFAYLWWVGGPKSTMAAKRRAFIKAENDMVEKSVRHDTMHTGQQCVNPDKVQAIMDNPTDNRPIIHKWNGYHIVFDGNHRIVADVLSGKQSSRCMVADLDKFFDKEGNLKDGK